jgi:glycosyltransferase involved in cell wall biosynthesis
MLALLRLSGARVLFIAHDPLPHAFRLPPRWRWIEIAAHGLCYRLSSAVVVLSDASRDRLHAAFPRLDRQVEVIDHGVFPLGQDIAPPGDGLLLCFGTVRRNKHVAEAIAGVALARRRGADVRLLIAGEAHRDEADYARACQQMADEAGDGVELRLGYLDDANLPQVMAECDAFLMPYGDFHSQSGVALLAASNGWPLIATDAGGLATLIAEGMPAQRIEAPVSAETVAAAVTAFRATPIEDWRRQARAYQALTLEKRSWRAIGARYLALCARL